MKKSVLALAAALVTLGTFAHAEERLAAWKLTIMTKGGPSAELALAPTGDTAVPLPDSPWKCVARSERVDTSGRAQEQVTVRCTAGELEVATYGLCGKGDAARVHPLELRGGKDGKSYRVLLACTGI